MVNCCEIAPAQIMAETRKNLSLLLVCERATLEDCEKTVGRLLDGC